MLYLNYRPDDGKLWTEGCRSSGLIPIADRSEPLDATAVEIKDRADVCAVRSDVTSDGICARNKTYATGIQMPSDDDSVPGTWSTPHICNHHGTRD